MLLSNSEYSLNALNGDNTSKLTEVHEGPESTYIPTTQSPVVQPFFVLQENESQCPKLTEFRLFVTIIVLCVGLYIAGKRHARGGMANAGVGALENSGYEFGLEMECVIGTMGTIGMYWLSIYESSRCHANPRVFHVGYRNDIRRGIKNMKSNLLFLFCIVGSTLSLVFSLGCTYLVLRIPGMEWIDTPEPSKGLYAAATKPLAMLFVQAMTFGGLCGAHILAEEALRAIRPGEGLSPYVVLIATVNTVIGQERRVQVGVYVKRKWATMREWCVSELLSERTPLRRAMTRQVRNLPYTILILSLYIIVNLMFAWLTAMGVALMKTLEDDAHWIAVVLMWGCALLEMGIGLCMICVFGVWFRDFVRGLVKEFWKDMEEGCEGPEGRE